MSTDDLFEDGRKKRGGLVVTPPFVWPDMNEGTVRHIGRIAVFPTEK